MNDAHGSKHIDTSFPLSKSGFIMKICILTNAHQSKDVRLYYKISHSLAKIAQVYLLCPSGIQQKSVNPYQIVVKGESSWNTLIRLYKNALKLKPDLVICVEPLTLLVGILLKKRVNCFLIVDIHEFFADAFAERFRFPLSLFMKSFYKAAERFLNSFTDAAMGVSAEVLASALPFGYAKPSLALPNYPVRHVWDHDCDVPAELEVICSTSFDLVYIGGLTQGRGIFHILQMAALLKKHFPQLKVLMVGRFQNTDDQKSFQAKINSLNLQSHIYYQEWVPAEKIGILLKRCKVGLWTFDPRNRRMKRALPLKVLEYFAAGLPVLSTKSALMRELIEKNNVGAICDFKPTSMAQEARKLLQMPKDEYVTMQDRALELIDQRYNWEALEGSLIELIYHFVLS